MVNAIGQQLWSYDMLKTLVGNERVTCSHMRELKGLFANDVGSLRRLENIRSVKDLIDVLERRDVLNEYRIDALRKIADSMESPEVQLAVSAYMSPKELTAAESINWYREQRLANEMGQHSNIALRNLATVPTQSVIPEDKEFTEKQRAAVHKLLSREIGTRWRFLGRELGLGEGSMDSIEVQFPNDLSSRISKMLQLFESDESRSQTRQVTEICEALDACGRKDLRRKVREMLQNST